MTPQSGREYDARYNRRTGRSWAGGFDEDIYATPVGKQPEGAYAARPDQRDEKLKTGIES